MTRTLLYDADCGFCATSAGWAKTLGCDVVPVPWQAYDELASYDITPEAAATRLHLVDDGEVVTGHTAVARTLRSSTHGLIRLAGRVTGARALRPLAARTYDLVAANRYRLPGGTDSCRLD